MYKKIEPTFYWLKKVEEVLIMSNHEIISVVFSDSGG